MNLPGKWLKNSEFISKQKEKGAEADQISPGYPTLNESRVHPKNENRQRGSLVGWLPLAGGSLHTKLVNFHRDTSQGTENKPMFVFKGQSNIPLQTFP